MQIFVTHPEPYESAAALDDRRLNKMIVETAQILSTARRQLGDDSPILYKATHANHPCVKWAAHSYHNHVWLKSLFYWLCRVREDRGFGAHLTATKLGAELNIVNAKLFKRVHQTPFVNCTPHKEMDTLEAYRLLLNTKWDNDKLPPKWTQSASPFWRTTHG